MPSGPLGSPSSGFPILVTALDAGGLLVGARLLWSGVWAERPVWRREPALLIFLMAGLMLVAAPLGSYLTDSTFVRLRLACHVLFCVVAPLLLARGLWLAARVRGRGHVACGLAMAAVGLGMDLTYWYAREVEPFNLQVRRYPIVSPALRTLNKPLRIVVLADLQTDRPGLYEERVFDLVDAERPDMILFPGDYLEVLSQEQYETERPRLLALFQRLVHRPPFGMYGVHGDVDWSPDTLDGTGVRILEDESVRIPGLPLQVVGLVNAWERAAVPAALAREIATFDGLSIVLAHRPDFAEDVIANGVDLDGPARLLGVAGHTHGGQIVIPGFGPPITLSRLPRRYAGGFHELRRRGSTELGGWLMVSRGVGCEREYAPRIRLFCPPELIVLELSARQP